MEKDLYYNVPFVQKCLLEFIKAPYLKDEEKFLRKIVKELEKMQIPQALHVTDYSVGLRSRVNDLILKLKLDCKDVLVVSVMGISGIGKTTIVKAAYNRIARNFDVSCFFADIHYHCQGPNWKVDLPKALISCLAQNDKSSIMPNHNDGVTKIKQLINMQKVLLVLDDVDNFKQLEALGIKPGWFYNGSRIIVTTRDKWSLGDIPHVSYHTKLLNERESLNLFIRLMFARDDHVNTKFIEEVVSHAGGLPLVLKVWSRHFKQYEKEQWPNILETLKRIPHGDIQKQLQMSYDSLPNQSKKLFLDIACFFDKMDKELVVKVLQDKDLAFFPDNEIQYLIDKSLVKLVEILITKGPRVGMHNVIREMGQEIVRRENENEPGKRSRLWDPKEVTRVLDECSGTKSVESIKSNEWNVTVAADAFRKMSNLRLIKLKWTRLSWIPSTNDTRPLSFDKLKYMEWDYFPFKCINNIHMRNVVVIKLHHSKLEILWEGFKNLKRLRILDVSYSTSLTKSGDFYGLENLEEIYFNGCKNLKELHSSIDFLQKLAILDLSSCTPSLDDRVKLHNFSDFEPNDYPDIQLEPDDVISSWRECNFHRPLFLSCNILKFSGEIGRIKRLKHLDLGGNGFLSLPDNLHQLQTLERFDLSYCPNLKSIPDLPTNVTNVNASYCRSLVNLPSNMSELEFLEDLWLDGCSKLRSECLMTITRLRSLRKLSMKNCNVSQVPSEVGNLVSLETLYLSGNTFSCLPDSFSNFSKLNTLEINDCSQLQLLPLLPSNLKRIEAHNCLSLEWMPHDLMQMSYIFRIKAYKDSPYVVKKLQILLSWETWKIPNWFTYGDPYVKGNVLSFVAPLHTNKKISGIILCFSSYFKPKDSLISIKLLNKTRKTSDTIFSLITMSKPFMVVVFYRLKKSFVVEEGDNVELQFHEDPLPKRFWKYGLRLIYEGDMLDSKLLLQNVTEPTSTMPENGYETAKSQQQTILDNSRIMSKHQQREHENTRSKQKTRRVFPVLKRFLRLM